MHDEPTEGARPFRFGLRTMLLLVTGLCIVAGYFRFIWLVFLLLMGVLLAQGLFFLLVQRLVNLVAGSPARTDEGADPEDADS